MDYGLKVFVLLLAGGVLGAIASVGLVYFFSVSSPIIGGIVGGVVTNVGLAIGGYVGLKIFEVN